MTHPHHALIRELYVSSDAASALLAEAEKLRFWTLETRQADELTLLLNGGFAPLRGYMTQADYKAVQDGAVAPWPVPLALRIDRVLAGNVQPGDDIALLDAGGVIVAVLSVTDVWGTPVLLGGKVKGLRRPASGLAPNGLRARFRDRGAERVLAIQPEDHAGDIRAAAELAQRLDAMLLVQPLPGVVVVRMPANAILAPLPVAPPPGPHAALWQAMVARNHGATHLMLADPAARDVCRQNQDRIEVVVVDSDGSCQPPPNVQAPPNVSSLSLRNGQR